MIHTSSFGNFGNLYCTRKSALPLAFSIYCLCSIYFSYLLRKWLYFISYLQWYIFFFNLFPQVRISKCLWMLFIFLMRSMFMFLFYSCPLYFINLNFNNSILFSSVVFYGSFSKFNTSVTFILSVVDIHSNWVNVIQVHFIVTAFRFWHWIVSLLC